VPRRAFRWGLAAVLLAAPLGAAAKPLCPPFEPFEPGDELRMLEGDFELERALGSLAFLRDEFIDSDRRSSIGYENSLMRLEGALLHQHVLLLRAEQAPPAELAAATERFCTFLRGAIAAD
jgi:hypothetical protein